MQKVSLLVLIWVVLASLVWVGCKTTRAGYESAPYQVNRKDGRFEVRDYPRLVLVETPATAESSDGSFGRLFRYISGSNQDTQKIAMTTPVFMSGHETNSTMAFVMPAKMGSAQVPAPSEQSVRVREVEAGRFAVYRFGGGRNPEREGEALAKLQTWMESEKLSPLSGPVYGYFDPPWTPAFLRRNEVMIRVPSE